MRKKGICFGLILALLLPFVFTTEVKASDNTELNIYAFYLNSENLWTACGSAFYG